MRKREGLAALLAAEGQPSWRSGPVQFSPVPGKLAFGQSGRSKPLKPEQPGSRSAHGFLQRAYLSIRCGLLPGVKICRILSKIVPRGRPRVNVETDSVITFGTGPNTYSAAIARDCKLRLASSQDARVESHS